MDKTLKTIMNDYGFASRFPRMSIGPGSLTVGRTELARLSSPGVTLAQADPAEVKIDFLT